MQNNELSILQTINEQSARFKLPSNGQKPCITAILQHHVEEGFRNNAIHIVSCDLLNRQLLSLDRVEEIMHDFNHQMKPPLPPKEVSSIVKSASKIMNNGRGRTYGCKSTEPLIVDNCLGLDYCPFYQKHFTNINKSKKGTIEDLMR